MQRKSNTAKIRRIQRLTDIELAKSYRTTSYEALCVLTVITTITVELEAWQTFIVTPEGKKTRSVYDCTVEDIEYICNSKSTLC